MKKISFVLLLTGFCLFTTAQQVSSFKQLRYDEDHRYLQNDSNANWYTRTKYTALSKDKHTYISFGGDIRYQYFFFKNESWGADTADKDGYILSRYLVHADLHAGKHFRTFVQLQSSLANGRNKPPSPVDENQLDLHQAFVDIVKPFGRQDIFTLRIGRQELLYGTQRLVAVRDGPNNRQSFDAAKLMYAGTRLKADIFYSHFVRSRQHIFDDGFNKNTKFWGAYLVVNKLPLVQNIDLYYFGLWKRQAVFDDGPGKELRHSAGGRIWNSKKNFRYDIEGVWQFGKFAEKNIRAWTLSFNAGYKLSKLKFKPEPGIKTEWISGDAVYGDKKLQSFNPLFPRGGYFGLVSLIGPSNLFDIHPSVAFELTKKLLLNIDYDLFWRYSKHDGIYGPNAALIYSGKSSSNKYIGRQLSTDIVYNANAFLYFRLEFTWFKAGEFLKDVTPGKDIYFVGFTTQLRF